MWTVVIQQSSVCMHLVRMQAYWVCCVLSGCQGQVGGRISCNMVPTLAVYIIQFQVLYIFIMSSSLFRAHYAKHRRADEMYGVWRGSKAASLWFLYQTQKCKCHPCKFNGFQRGTFLHTCWFMTLILHWLPTASQWHMACCKFAPTWNDMRDGAVCVNL